MDVTVERQILDELSPPLRSNRTESPAQTCALYTVASNSFVHSIQRRAPACAQTHMHALGLVLLAMSS
eukprot:5468521-Pleurochrysis_carterae.AAC.1